MTEESLNVEAKISSDSTDLIEPLLQKVAPDCTITRIGSDLHLKGTIKGNDPKEENRSILSRLRKVEKKTRIRAKYRTGDGTTYSFFDYVLKKTEKEK